MQDDAYTWQGDIVHETESESDAPKVRLVGSGRTLKVALGDVDLPAFVSNGVLYIQAPLPHIFKAFAESLSDFVSDMEIRVSDSRGRALPLDSDGRPVSRKGLAQSRVVRGGGQ